MVTSTSVGAMDWAIALRRSGDPDFFYTFSDHTVGRVPTSTVSETGVMFRSTFEAAIDRFIKAWNQSRRRAVGQPKPD
jgi:hypothetical protein